MMKFITLAFLLISSLGFSQGHDLNDMIDAMPRFNGCEDQNLGKEDLKKCAEGKLLEYIYSNISYPRDAQEQGIEGTVIVRFFINEMGKVESPKIMKSVGGGCDEEVLKMISGMPAWIPGIKDGEPVKIQWNLPVKFELPAEPELEEEDELHTVTQEMPRFKSKCENLDVSNIERKKCAEKEMLMHIYENILYPAEARENGIEGTVVARFVINKEGVVENLEIVRPIGGGCDEEVARLINTMKWIPGMQDGEAVKVQFNLPVRFKLEGREKKKKKKSRKKKKQ